MNEIRPEHLRLTYLLRGRLFRIPEYQRSYSWTARQRADLFADIEGVYARGPDASHFMATVVCLRKEEQELGTDIYHVLDVVDGQQRLTTIVILFKAVQLALRRSASRNEKRIAQEIKDLLVKGVAGDLLLLQTNHDSSHYFSNYISKGVSKPRSKAKTIADRELLAAIEECQDFVATWQRAGRPLAELVALLKNRLSFILYEISQEREVYTVFEVLNSRGIEVSWLDRLKSMLMGAAFELEEGDPAQLVHELHVIWRDVYSTVGLRQGLSSEALRFAATLRATEANKPLGDQDSVDLLRKWTASGEQIREIAGWLLKVTEACHAVLSNNRLDAVTRIAQARLLAVAIHLMDIDERERQRLVDCWERVSFRIYGMFDKDARTGVGEYVRLSRQCIQSSVTAEDVEEGILRIGSSYPIEEAVDCLSEANCYDGWQDELRYMLYRYEEHLSEEEGNNFGNEQWIRIWMETASRSIEHVWAQSRAPEDFRHRLGNLTMLPPRLNSKLKDEPFAKKRKAYKETGLLDAQNVAANQRWSKNAIRDREKSILDWAAKEWADR